MGTKNSLFGPKMAEKNEFKDTYPLQKEKKLLKIEHLCTNDSLASRTVLNLRSHLQS